MSEIPDRAELIEEIEIQQNDVIRQLDELNQRVEATLKKYSPRSSKAEASDS